MHPEYTFTSQYHVVDDLRLHYIDHGQGPVVVLVHGNPTWSFFYRKMITLLSRSYRVIALDNLGCGLSDKPQGYDYTLENHIHNMSELLRHLNIGRFSLVVHDWGGAIGMGYAVDKVKSIDRIVILNTAAFRSSSIPLRIRICRFPILGEFIVRGLNGFVRPALSMAVEKKMDQLTRKMYLLPYDSWANRIAVYSFVKDIPLASSHPSYATLVAIENKLSDIAKAGVPMLILWGGRDFCFTKSFYDEWRRRFPAAQSCFFDDKGHYLLEDSFQDLIPELQRFFKIDDNGEDTIKNLDAGQ